MNKTKFILKLVIYIALTFTFSCSSGNDNDDRNSFSYQGKTYKTVKIGSQTWMAENLNHEVSGSLCYKRNPANCNKYGRLYKWEAAKKACPEGWRLPSNADWDKLVRHADGTSGTESPYNSPTAGKFLKADNGWNGGGNGTNDFGFSALPGGYGSSDGDFYSVGEYGFWWSAIEDGSSFAYYRDMDYNAEYVSWSSAHKYAMFSVRCVQE